MSQKTHRVRRKLRRLAQTSVSRQIDSEMNKLRAKRDETMRAINLAYEKQHAELLEKRLKARFKAWTAYDEERGKLIKQYADLEQKMDTA